MVNFKKNLFKNYQSSYMPVNALLLTIAGLYSYEIKSKSLLKMYAIYRTFCIFICVFLSVWIIAGMWKRETFVLIENAGTILHLTVYITTCYLLLYFYVKQDHLQRIFTFMENDFSYSSEPGVYKISMLHYINGSKLITRFWTCWAPFAVISVSLAPTLTRGLPHLVWCFYDCYVSPAFEITVFIELLGQFVIGAVFLATDILFPCFAYIGIGQFRITGCNYRNVFYTALLKLGVSTESVLVYSRSFVASPDDDVDREKQELISSINNIVQSQVFDETLSEIFSGYVKRHQKLLKYIEDVDNFFSDYFIVKMGMYIAYVIVIIYLILLGTDRTLAFSLITYFLGSIVPTFLFNYFGQLFVDEYNEISLSLYKSPWYMASKRFQKSFLIVHMATSRRLTLTAGKIVDMNMDTFKGFMRLLMSFSTFIRKMSERDN